MRKYISIVESLNEATPVKPVQPVKPMKPGDPRHTAQNTTAVNDPTPGSMEHRQKQQAQQAQFQKDQAEQGLDHKLPNGKPQQPLPNGQPQQDDSNGSQNLANTGRPEDELDPEATDENGDPIDPELVDGIADGQRAAQFLKKQGVIEAATTGHAEEYDYVLNHLRMQGAKPEPSPHNPVGYKGLYFSGGYADLHSGQILYAQTFKDLVAAGRAPAEVLDKVTDGDAFWFTFKSNEETGEIEFTPTFASGPVLARKLERMIRAQLD